MKKRKDGRYSKQVTLGIRNGKPFKKTVYGKTIKECEKNYRELMLLVDKGAVPNNESLTLHELKEEWYRIKKKGKVKLNTELAYSSVLKTMDSTIGALRLKDISQYLIEECLNRIQYVENHGRKAELYLYLLNSIFAYGIQREYIYKNPCLGLSVKFDKQKKRALEPHEKDLINSSTLPPREQAILYLLRYTGLRRGELFALTKNDIDKTNLTISINKTLIDSNGSPFLQNTTKTAAGSRVMPIFIPLTKPLFSYLDSINTDHLFLNRNGNFCCSCTMHNTIKQIAKKLGLGEDISFHTFRHNFITECYIAGVDVKRLQQWVGHTDISTTLNVYTHLDRETLTNCSEMNTYYCGSQTEVNFPIKEVI